MRGRWDPVNEAIHAGVVQHHAGRHAGRRRSRRSASPPRPRGMLDPRSPPPNRKIPHGRRYRNTRYRPVRHAVRLQVGLRDRHRDGLRAQGAERGHHPPDLRPQGGAGMAAGMAAEGLRGVAEDGGAALGARRSSADRLPGPPLLRRAEEEGRPEEPGRGRSRTAARPTRSSASR